MGFSRKTSRCLRFFPNPVFFMCGMYWRINLSPIRAVSMDSRHISGVTFRKSPLGAGGMVIAKMSGSGLASSSLARSQPLMICHDRLNIDFVFNRNFLGCFFQSFLSPSGNHSSTPASANRSAVARPIPALPPAIIAFLPVI